MGKLLSLAKEVPRAVRYKGVDASGTLISHVVGDDLDLHLSVAESLRWKKGRRQDEPGGALRCGLRRLLSICDERGAPSLGIRMPSKLEDSVIDTTVHLVGYMKDLELGHQGTPEGQGQRPGAG